MFVIMCLMRSIYYTQMGTVSIGFYHEGLKIERIHGQLRLQIQSTIHS